MNKSRRIFWVCSLLLVSMAVSATTPYERIRKANDWNVSENIAGVRQDSLSVSYAELSGGYIGGDFRESYQAKQSWNVAASTASITHLQKMSLVGSFSFRQTEHYDMCGSMFIQPGFFPVDVMEFTPGRKSLQEYAFDGGIAYDVNDTWRIGAQVDFVSANMAKRKDLRHTNWRLNLSAKPSVMYHKGDFAFGTSYIFEKNSESVEAEQVGVSASSYYAFLNKGLYYGIYSVWGGSGLHLDEAGVNSFPVNELLHGAALQMQYKGFFAQFAYRHKDGVVGEKDRVWFRYPAHRFDLMLAYQQKGHFAHLDMGVERLRLFETILESISANGVTTTTEYGQNRILTQANYRIAPSYEYISSQWELLAMAEYKIKEGLSSQIYPYLYHQTLSTWNVFVKGTGHVSAFDVELGLGAAAGNVVEDQNILEHNMSVLSKPYRHKEWYQWDMEYQTALRLNAELSLRYNFWKGLYVEINAACLYGLGLKQIKSPIRYEVGLKTGYNF